MHGERRKDLKKTGRALVDGDIKAQAPKTWICGLGTAVPNPPIPQEQITDFFRQVALAQPEAPGYLARSIERLGRGSGIEQRFSVLNDYRHSQPQAFEFYPDNWRLEPFPSTATRMALYRDNAVPLAEKAAQSALQDAGIQADQVTHLIISTCTGFFAPGPDVQLVRALGLSPKVQRCIIGFMGCFAGINALRQADQIVSADPDAVVLQVSVELCSLHFQRTPTMRAAVANTLFGDGAAAAVYASRPVARCYGGVLGTASAIHADSQDAMRWEIGNQGFLMELMPSVPQTLQTATRPFVQELLQGSAADLASARYAIHPGGKKIIEAVENAVDKRAGGSAYEVLRRYGNMSSATILFVLREELARSSDEGRVVLLAFGPGLTIEGAAISLDRP